VKKKSVFLVLFLFLLPQLAFPQVPWEYGRWDASEKIVVIDATSAAADSLKVEGRVIAKGKLSYSNLSFTGKVIARGTNDSTVITIQTTANPDDSTTWQTILTVGPMVSTTVFYARTIPTGVAVRDTVLAIHPYIRIYEDHSVAAWTAADTSSYYLFIRQWGEKI